MTKKKEFILRQDALEWTNPDEWGTPDEQWRPESEFGAMIKVLPAADVRENVLGKWVENRAGDCVCQRCGYEALCFYGGQPCKSNFCPNCGAIMDAS